MKPTETVDYHIKATWHSISRMYNSIAAKYEISQAIGYVLLHIDKEGTPATKIAPLMGMEPTSLSRLLKSMENNALIYRQGDTDDKRVVRIFLTEAGVEKKRVAQNVIRLFNEKVRGSLREQEVQTFFKVMETINGLTENFKAEN